MKQPEPCQVSPLGIVKNYAHSSFYYCIILAIPLKPLEHAKLQQCANDYMTPLYFCLHNQMNILYI